MSSKVVINVSHYICIKFQVLYFHQPFWTTNQSHQFRIPSITHKNLTPNKKHQLMTFLLSNYQYQSFVNTFPAKKVKPFSHSAMHFPLCRIRLEGSQRFSLPGKNKTTTTTTTTTTTSFQGSLGFPCLGQKKTTA